MMAPNSIPADAIVRVDRCRLAVGHGTWAYAAEHAAEIAAHWQRRSAESPALFDGRIFLLEALRFSSDALEATFLPTCFRSLLYWKECGYSDRSVRDAFGSALIRSREGHVLLGRQAAGHINAGLAYLPGGFIDARDVGADGAIDIEASIAREIAEETGLDATALTRVPGYHVTLAGPLVSIAAEFRSDLPSAELAEGVRAHIAADRESELAAVVVVRSAADLDGLAMPEFARLLLRAILPGRA
jgi:8-oxo-dGTP pyrophosphatase MutT (NUDIX family)